MPVNQTMLLALVASVAVGCSIGMILYHAVIASPRHARMHACAESLLGATAGTVRSPGRGRLASTLR